MDYERAPASLHIIGGNPWHSKIQTFVELRKSEIPSRPACLSDTAEINDPLAWNSCGVSITRQQQTKDACAYFVEVYY